MAHFAELDKNNVVLRVVTVDNQNILDQNNLESEEKGIHLCKSFYGGNNRWIQTSYNGNFRFRYAGIGYTYNQEKNAFIPPQYLKGMILDDSTLDWVFPTQYPEDGKKYYWDEEEFVWKEIIN